MSRQIQAPVHTAISLSTGLKDHFDNTLPPPVTQTAPRHASSPGLIENTPLSDYPGSRFGPYNPNQQTLSSTLLPLSIPPTPSHPIAAVDMDDPERQTTNVTTINEKHSTPASQTCNPYRIWPPWERDDGWQGWRDEWVRKDALVIPLIVQAFSAGILDATTYADFMTFASNRKSSKPSDTSKAISTD
jgi:hypothetical protein